MDQDRFELHEVPSDGRSSILADVSREMVRLYKEQFGRGPTKARTCLLYTSPSPRDRS